MIGAKNNQKIVPGELIVKLKNGQSALSMKTSLFSTLDQEFGENSVQGMKPFVTNTKLTLIKIKAGLSIEKAIEALEKLSNVEYAEPNYILTIQDHHSEVLSGEPNDADFAKLWGMKNTGQSDSAGQVGTPGVDVNVLPLWEEGHTGSREILVAVIDTGIDWDHPDIIDNLYANPGEAGELAENGIDDDGNGFIDDTHGWNFAADSRSSDDDHSHGTHCAGTIGGVGNNSIGVAGVNWEVSLLPVKFLTAGGSGSLADAVESINYATLMNVDVMSNSWGGGGHSQTMEDAIKAARDKGILFVAAAGNDSSDNDSSPTYPAGYQVENVVSVAAIDNQDKLAYFSNWGRAGVHVAAPGVKIYSTVKGGTYKSYSGTSMATPHVAGVAALMMSIDSTLAYSDIKERLVKTSEPVRTLKRKVVAKGRVSAFNAVNNIEPPSDDPDESLWKDVEFEHESKHPYENNRNQNIEITQPGVQYIRIHFEKVELERKYDKILIKTPEGELIETIDGKRTDYTTDYIKGDTAILNFVSDTSVAYWGYRIDKIQVVE